MLNAMVLLSIAFASGLAAGSATLATPPARYDGHRVLRVLPRDAAERRMVVELAEELWTERVGPGSLDVRVTPEQASALDLSGVPYSVLHSDLQTQVEVERDRLAAPSQPIEFGTWFSDFRDLAEVEAYVDELAAFDSELVSLEDVGTSLEGRPIRAMRIGVPAEGKAAMILTGTMHAREWLSTMVTMCMADQLVRDFELDGEIAQLLRSIDVYVIPVINPDGYTYAWEAERYWRKNRRDGVGVDLNRNWGYQWGGEGASPNPGDENYRGTAPFSEPETTAVADYMQAHPALVSHIDFHAYAEIIIYPWGYGYEPAPDIETLEMLAGNMASAISGVHGRNYQPLQGANFYPAAGAVDDWVYGELDIMSFTIELRGNDFVISPEQIIPTCEENFAAMLDLAQWSAQFSEVDPSPGGTTGGPDSGDDGSGNSDDSAGSGTPGGSDSGSDSTPGSPDDDDADTTVPDTDGIPPFPAGYGNEDQAGCGCTTTEPTGPTALSLLLFTLLLPARPRTRGAKATMHEGRAPAPGGATAARRACEPSR